MARYSFITKRIVQISRANEQLLKVQLLSLANEQLCVCLRACVCVCVCACVRACVYRCNTQISHNVVKCHGVIVKRIFME